MINAYSVNYLNNAMNLLGSMYDIAINEERIDINSFTMIFILSKFSKLIENGDPNTIVGKSSIEILQEILDKKIEISHVNYNRSKEYWIGYVLAYSQWYLNKSFKNILEVMSITELSNLYSTLHEADIKKTAYLISERLKKIANLKKIRLKRRLSQSELSKLSGVKLRTIKSYEQKELDISKAQVDTLFKLSKTLVCEIQDLID